MTNPNWRDAAACLEIGGDAFFSETNNHRAVIAICNGCPVRAICLADALATPGNEDFGVAGGTTAAERRRIRRTTA